MTKFKPDNHIVGKVYDLTQENMQAMLIYIDKLEEDQEMFLNEHDENVRLHFENVDLKEQNARLREALTWFLDDPRFEVSVDGNLYAVDQMLNDARAALESK